MNQNSPYTPPTASLVNESELVWSGENLKLTTPASLPCICINCAADTDTKRVTSKLHYLNPLTFLWLLLSPIALIIAYYAFRKKVEISFSQCTSCLKKAEKWSLAIKASLLIFLISITLRIFISSAEFIMPLALVIFGSLLFSLFAVAMKDTQLSVKSASGDVFYIKGIKKEVKSKLVNG